MRGLRIILTPDIIPILMWFQSKVPKFKLYYRRAPAFSIGVEHHARTLDSPSDNEDGSKVRKSIPEIRAPIIAIKGLLGHPDHYNLRKRTLKVS